jgi:hypothetical protein
LEKLFVQGYSIETSRKSAYPNRFSVRGARTNVKQHPKLCQMLLNQAVQKEPFQGLIACGCLLVESRVMPIAAIRATFAECQTDQGTGWPKRRLPASAFDARKVGSHVTW